MLAAYGERWAPHRSVAAWYLWRALELYKAGTLPPPAERIRLPRVRVRRITDATLTFPTRARSGREVSAAEIRERTERVLEGRFARLLSAADAATPLQSG